MSHSPQTIPEPIFANTRFVGGSKILLVEKSIPEGCNVRAFLNWKCHMYDHFQCKNARMLQPSVTLFSTRKILLPPKTVICSQISAHEPSGGKATPRKSPGAGTLTFVGPALDLRGRSRSSLRFLLVSSCDGGGLFGPLPLPPSLRCMGCKARASPRHAPALCSEAVRLSSQPVHTRCRETHSPLAGSAACASTVRRARSAPTCA